MNKLVPTTLLLLISSFCFSQEITFNSDQVDEGKEIYVEHCQICHGTNLDNGQFATPIKGFFFAMNWGGRTLGELARFTWEEMPEGNGKSLRVEEYIASIAFILSENGIEASDTAMSEDFDTLEAINLPF
ncbi:MAG: cytochrome c [Gammaproteobacteria bacterium]|jgi:alcohol dehydrogenase (cytochrome c)|nr:cytochrome c [Gammaproteobacteria bacterium]